MVQHLRGYLWDQTAETADASAPRASSRSMDDAPASAALPVPSRRASGLEPGALFLSRSCPENVMDNSYLPLEASTSGSPESIHTPGIPNPHADEQSRPTRPRVGNRVGSSPVSPRPRGKSTPRTKPTALFASLNRPRSSKREWTVFEQRMENEGQMWTKDALRESVSESAAPSPFHHAAEIATRSESPTNGAPSLRRVVVEGGHESDDASTIGYDSDSDSEAPPRPFTPISAQQPRKQRWYSKLKPPPLTPLQRNILKCAVAYFVGSLFTFNLTLSSLITSVISTGNESAPSKSGHLVATV